MLLNAIHSLDDESGDPIDSESSQVFDEDQVKEVLSAMIKSHGKGSGKRTFTAVNQAKRTKELARGYGSGRFADRKFQRHDGLGGSGGLSGGTYKVPIEAFKRRTRCGLCKQIGHWHRE